MSDNRATMIQPHEITAEMLWDLEMATGEEIKFISYSGRAMWGQTCFGAVLPCVEDAFVWALNLNEQFHDILSDPRVDDMGRNIVVYFPHVRVSDETINEWEEI